MTSKIICSCGEYFFFIRCTTPRREKNNREKYASFSMNFDNRFINVRLLTIPSTPIGVVCFDTSGWIIGSLDYQYNAWIPVIVIIVLVFQSLIMSRKAYIAAQMYLHRYSKILFHRITWLKLRIRIKNLVGIFLRLNL